MINFLTDCIVTEIDVQSLSNNIESFITFIHVMIMTPHRMFSYNDCCLNLFNHTIDKHRYCLFLVSIMRNVLYAGLFSFRSVLLISFSIMRVV